MFCCVAVVVYLCMRFVMSVSLCSNRVDNRLRVCPQKSVDALSVFDTFFITKHIVIVLQEKVDWELLVCVPF